MINPKDIPYLFIKKEPLLGSDKGMRFRLAKASDDDGDYIDACVWPEPYNYDKTDDNLKTHERFDLSPSGVEEAVDWLNSQKELRAELWNQVYGKPLLTIM